MLLILIIIPCATCLLALLLMTVKLCVEIFKCNCKCSQHLVGKVVVVTGASSGIGYETAKDLAERGARVIITSITQQLADEAKDNIIKATGNKDVYSYFLDLASFDSIREFAESVLKTETRLDVLINNAGVLSVPNVKTKDGLLLGMQINYFGPFYLTKLLLPILKASAPSRIINVASSAYSSGNIDMDDLNLNKTQIGSMAVYANSKYCMVMMTVELSRRLSSTGVTVNCLHPGFVDTSIMNSSSLSFYFGLIRPFFKTFVKSPWEGAQTSIYLAVSPEVSEVSGRYFRDCKQISIIKSVLDEKRGRVLWDETEKLIIKNV